MTLLYHRSRKSDAGVVLTLITLLLIARMPVKGFAIDRTSPAAEIHEATVDDTLTRASIAVHQLLEAHQYRKAVPLAQAALKLAEDAYGKMSPQYVEWLGNVAVLLHGANEYAEAEPLYRQLLEHERMALGEDHPEYAITLNALARLYRDMGEHAKAEPLLLQAVRVTREALGEEHPDHSTSLNSLAMLYYDMGDYAKADPLLREALELARRTHGEDDLMYAVQMSNLAVLYRTMGDYIRADTLFREALAISSKTLDGKHLHHAVMLNGQAALHRAMGEYASAEVLHRQAIAIRKQTIGEDHPQYATGLNGLALLYQSTGQHAKAESLFRQSTEIIRQTLGEQHATYGGALNNLAGLYVVTGKYEDAEALYREAIAIQRRTLGRQHASYAKILSNLGVVLRNKGDYAGAESAFREAMNIQASILGDHHPDTCANVRGLASVFHEMGAYAKAEPVFRTALQSEVTFLTHTAGGLPESRAMTLLEEWAGPDSLLSILRQLPDHNTRHAYDAVWQSRSVVTRLLADRRRTVVQAPEAEAVFDRLRSAQQQLAQLTLAETRPEQREVRRQRLAELNEEKEALEAELAQISAPFRREIELERVGPEELVQVLPPDTAVIDIVGINLRERQPDGGRLESILHYEAFVLQPASDGTDLHVSWIHLGPAEPIDQALAAWRKAIIERQALPPGDDRPDRILRRLVWKKVEPCLKGRVNVYLIPDGELAFLPWAALPGRRPGTCLIEDYNIVTATHGQELYRGLTAASSTSGGLLLVGDIHYDRAPPAPAAEMLAAADAQTPLTRSPAPGTEPVWRRLPATAEEMANIKQTWDSREPLVVLRGEEPGESALRAHLPGNRYIHLATHGFFADEKFRSMFGHDVGGEQLFGSAQFLSIGHGSVASRGQVTARNPLILSGVVLAGANLPPKTDELGLPTGEDGILTAEEIVSFDLRGTELVVLSACETGLGSVGGGEGVFGLQRAFHLAGARNVIASLWKVDDQAAAALMRVFYHKLWHENKSPAVALREAQLTLYRQPDQIDKLAGLRGPDFDKIVSRKDRQPDPGPAPADIRRWAAFVLSGPGR